jgi:hypothetical protein
MNETWLEIMVLLAAVFVAVGVFAMLANEIMEFVQRVF